MKSTILLSKLAEQFRRVIMASVAMLLLGQSTSLQAGEIRGWRNDWTGVFPDADPPTSWGPGKNEVWSTDLGDGFQSSPVLIGDKVITAVNPDKLVCLRASDGKMLWKTSHDLWKDVLSGEEAASARKLAAEAEEWKKEVDRLDEVIGEAGRPASQSQMKAEYKAMTQEQRDALVNDATAKKEELMKHPHAGLKWVNLSCDPRGAGYACATPVTDGKFVYYVFGNGLAICCDLETGKRMWHTKLAGELGYQHHGTSGSSPALAGDRVIVRFGNWLYGLKASDGSQVWEQREPEKWTRRGFTTFSTAVVVNIDTTPVVVTLSGQFLRASDGKLLADLDLYANSDSEMVPTPVVDQGVIYFPVGKRKLSKKWGDIRPAHLLAVKLPDQISGDALQPKILWKTETPSADTGSSPVVFDGLLYIRDYMGSWLRVFDIRDGSLVYEKNLAEYLKDVTPSSAYGSLTVAGGNLYINSSMVDRTLIIKTGREYSEVARNERGSTKKEIGSWMKPYGFIFATNPVFSGSRMYWRENDKMYCFAKDAASKPAVPSDAKNNGAGTTPAVEPPKDIEAKPPAASDSPARQSTNTGRALPAWPYSDGPTRDGISPETGLFANLKNGPEVVWKASLGTGFTSIIISGGLVYAAGNKDDKDIITAFDAVTGKPAWTYSYDEPMAAEGFDGGPCATPCVAGGKLYNFSRSGRVNSLDATTGKLSWSKDLGAELGAEPPQYGYAGSPTVIGERLFLNIGSAGCCLNAATGEVIWKSPAGKAGYAAPVPFTVLGKPALLIFSGDGLYAVDAATGQVVMKYPWKDMEGATAPTPLVHGTQVFLSSGFSDGGVMLDTAAGDFKEVWRTGNMSNKYSGCVLVDGFLYGFDSTTLRCLDWSAGKARWEHDGFGDGSLVAAERRLVVLSEDGDMVIAEARPDAFHQVSGSKVLKPTCWARPSVAGGRIYCRNSGGDLVCVELK